MNKNVVMDAPALPRRNISLKLTGCCVLFALSNGAFAVDVVYSYDDLNRVNAMSYGGTASDPNLAINYDEVGNITDATITHSPDTDGDKIADFADPDADNDGMPNTWELAHGLNPLDPSDANSDADHDGVTALNEYLNGTDPNVPDNVANNHDTPMLPPWALTLFGALLARSLLRARSRSRQAT